ncbi:hypothetical protein ACL9RF_04965 [Sphingobacterium sp. Mn56C]|uniref:hypothetical protein n=1 Tax=Sphingobacterium sp. Mn56C TaxID=3395261 RepID=UPI003BDC1D9C
MRSQGFNAIFVLIIYWMLGILFLQFGMNDYFQQEFMNTMSLSAGILLFVAPILYAVYHYSRKTP